MKATEAGYAVRPALFESPIWVCSAGNSNAHLSPPAKFSHLGLSPTDVSPPPRDYVPADNRWREWTRFVGCTCGIGRFRPGGRRVVASRRGARHLLTNPNPKSSIFVNYVA